MNVFVLIFGVLYPLIALAVACLGVFGMSVSRNDINAQIERNFARNWSFGPGSGTFAVGWMWRSAFVLLAATAWPIGIPLYLSWKKGSLINDALVERARLAAEAER